MNKPLSLVLLAAIGDLPYIDRKSGIVQVISKKIKVSDSEFVIKKYPVSTIADLASCQNNTNAYTAYDMIPNSKLKGLLYFEDNGTTILGRRSSSQQYNSNMRLVCWLNTKNIKGTGADLTLGAKVMNNLIQLLTASSFNSEPFINILVKVTKIPEMNADIFSPYTYDETVTQYLMSPFDFFAIDLNISFYLPRNCPIEINIGEPNPCP